MAAATHAPRTSVFARALDCDLGLAPYPALFDRSRRQRWMPSCTNSMRSACFERRVSNIIARNSSSRWTGRRNDVNRRGSSVGGSGRRGGSSSSSGTAVGTGVGDRSIGAGGLSAGVGTASGTTAVAGRSITSGGVAATAGWSPLASPFRISPAPSVRSSFGGLGKTTSLCQSASQVLPQLVYFSG